AVEMEGAALAQAASHLGVPFAVVRILSDSADGDAVQDFPAFLAEAAERDRQLARMLVVG
ncbi:phosphorylase family protein, partial [Acidipropionibacterium jensenii]|nr:5'-methylthioadenosine/adenosylhomocysteine nucleosidase [Acidipropionibacterium jensenii]